LIKICSVYFEFVLVLFWFRLDVYQGEQSADTTLISYSWNSVKVKHAKHQRSMKRNVGYLTLKVAMHLWFKTIKLLIAHWTSHLITLK